MRTTKRKILNIIKENYSKYDLDLLKKLNQPKDGPGNAEEKLKKLYSIVYWDITMDDVETYLKILKRYLKSSEGLTDDMKKAYDIINKGGDYMHTFRYNGGVLKDLVLHSIKNTDLSDVDNLISDLNDANVLPYGKLNDIIPPNEYFDTKTKDVSDYKKTFGWVIHQTRTFERMVSILENGFTRGAKYDDLIGGQNDYGDDDEYAFGYDISDYDNSIGYGQFFVILKTNYVKAYHKKDNENQVMFGINKKANIYPIAYDREKFSLISNRGDVLFSDTSLGNVCSWIDTNGRQYSKLLNFNGFGISRYKDVITKDKPPRTKGNDIYDKMSYTFKKILGDRF